MANDLGPHHNYKTQSYMRYRRGRTYQVTIYFVSCRLRVTTSAARRKLRLASLKIFFGVDEPLEAGAIAVVQASG